MFKEGEECFKGWDKFKILSLGGDMVELESEDERIFCAAHNLVEVNEGTIEVSNRIKESLYRVTSKGGRLINHREVRRFYETMWSIYVKEPTQSSKDTINRSVEMFEKDALEHIEKNNSISVQGCRIFEMQF